MSLKQTHTHRTCAGGGGAEARGQRPSNFSYSLVPSKLLHVFLLLPHFSYFFSSYSFYCPLSFSPPPDISEGT